MDLHMDLLDDAGAAGAAPPRATPEAGPPPEAARRTLAMRIAHRNRLRAERLARLRPGAAAAAPPVAAIPPAPEAPAADAGAALEEFLRALTGDAAAAGTAAPDPAPEAGGDAPDEPPPAAVLHFQRPGADAADAMSGTPGFAEATGGQPASDLALLPGMGPSLLWAFRRAGITSLDGLAGLDEPGLVARLGPLGRLVPAAAWLARARAAGS